MARCGAGRHHHSLLALDVHARRQVLITATHQRCSDQRALVAASRLTLQRQCAIMGRESEENRDPERNLELSVGRKGHRHLVHTCHVAVIGASAAGLFASYLLAQEGCQVSLFEQREALGPPPRTLIVTNQISQVLGFVPHEAVLNHIWEIELLSQNRRTVVKLGAPDLVLERERLTHLLSRKAQQAGVEIKLGYRFLGLEENRDSLSLELYDRTSGRVKQVKVRALVGADGVGSQVARAVGMADCRSAAIWQARVPLPARSDEHTVRVWFDKESTPFFWWLIPESKQTGVVGLVSENQEQAEHNLTRFVDAQGFELLSVQAADVALYHPDRQVRVQLVGSEAFLVGDAAGQVKATTAGGVVSGLKGARAVAGALLRSNTGKELPRLRRELGLHYVIRFLLNRFSNSDYDDLLDMVGGRTEEVLQTHTRDELLGAIFKLLVAQPRLLPLAARSLMRVSGEQRRT